MKEIIKFEVLFEVYKKVLESYNNVLKNTALKCGITLEESKTLMSLYFFKELNKKITFNTTDCDNLKQLIKKNLVTKVCLTDNNYNYDITGRGGIICKYILSSQQKFLDTILLNINESSLNILNEIISQIGNNTQ